MEAAGAVPIVSRLDNADGPARIPNTHFWAWGDVPWLLAKDLVNAKVQYVLTFKLVILIETQSKVSLIFDVILVEQPK